MQKSIIFSIYLVEIKKPNLHLLKRSLSIQSVAFFWTNFSQIWSSALNNLFICSQMVNESCRKVAFLHFTSSVYSVDCKSIQTRSFCFEFEKSLPRPRILILAHKRSVNVRMSVRWLFEHEQNSHTTKENIRIQTQWWALLLLFVYSRATLFLSFKCSRKS